VYCTGSGGRGSIPQPDQHLTSVDPLTLQSTVLSQEVGGADGVEVSNRPSKGPGDRAVFVGQGEDVFGEGHRSVACELSVLYRVKGEEVNPRRSCPPGTGAAAHGCRSHSRGDGRGRSSHGCGAAPPTRSVPPTVRWSRGR